MENKNILNYLLDTAINILIILENKRKLDESCSELKDKLNFFNLENYQICSEDIIDGAFNELQRLWGYQFVINIRSFHEIFCDILRDENISDENKDKLKNFLEKTKLFSQFISETKDIKYSTLSWK